MEAALTLGFFRGTSATTFSPEKTLTRAEMVTVLHRMAGTPEVETENPFRDVAPDRWYTDAITWAAANGIVQGKTADRFDPNAPVTREQIASILYRYATYLGMDVSARSELSGYGDAGKLAIMPKRPCLGQWPPVSSAGSPAQFCPPAAPPPGPRRPPWPFGSGVCKLNFSQSFT